MEDRELVAAIAAGDPAGLAGAYDKYAESLYGYCRSMLAEPGDAAEAVQDTFVAAVSLLSGSAGRPPGSALSSLGEPGKIRSWLFATARSECLRRPRKAPTGIGEVADVGGELGAARTAEASGTDGASGSDEVSGTDVAADVRRDAERAELQRLIRVTLAGLAPDEREAVELSLWHDLDDADLAAVLGVSRPRAYALASDGRRQLEKALGTVRVVRTGREACPELGTLLADWDGRLSMPALELAGQHIEHCEICDRRRSGTLRPAALRRLLPLPALPPELREQVLGRCAAAEAIADHQPVAQGTESPPMTAFPHAVATLAGSAWGKVTVWLAGLGRIRRDPKVIAAVVVVLIAAAVSVPLLAVGGAHAVRNLVAQSDSGRAGDPGSTGTASDGAPASTGTGGSRSPQPGSPAPANYLVPSAASPGKVTPSKSPTLKPPGSPAVTSSASASSSSSSSSSSSARPPSSRTPSSTPSSPSPSPTTPSPTPSPSPSPAPTSS